MQFFFSVREKSLSWPLIWNFIDPLLVIKDFSQTGNNFTSFCGYAFFIILSDTKKNTRKENDIVMGGAQNRI